jgi:hypothetical protein
MRRPLAGILLALLPFAVLAQQGPVLRESQPPDQPAQTEPQPPQPDDTVTSSPLPPADQDMPAEAQPEMVPNPLDDPNAAPGPGNGRPAQPQGQPQRGGWVQMGTATLQALDKVNARYDTLTVKVGDTAHFGSLNITVRGCFVRTPDRPADATAFLVIRDQHADAPAFSGWMVRSAPSMSMLANAIYDVRVTGCVS